MYKKLFGMSALLAMVTIGSQVAPASQRIQPTIKTDESVAAVNLSHEAYLPLWNVIQLLKAHGITSSWNGITWTLQEQHVRPSAKRVFRKTTYLPATAVIPTLQKAGLPIHWNGSVLTASSQGSTDAQTTAAGNVRSSSDQAFWNRASDNFYLTATMESGHDLFHAVPGDTIDLAGRASNASQPVHWYVSNSSAAVLPTSNGKAIFIAGKPGIYTVQEQWGKTYSVPMVLVVDLPVLEANAGTMTSSSVSGVAAMPANLTPLETHTESGVTYTEYTPIGGWIPVSGKVTDGSTRIVLNLRQYQDGHEADWSYTLPIAKAGTFSAMLRSPFQGTVYLSLIPHWFTQMTKTSTWTTNAWYSVDVKMPAPTELALDELASGDMDFNTNPAFAEVSSAVLANAPSKDAAIAAISNLTSEELHYAYSEVSEPGNYVWRDAGSAWNTRTGVCVSFADVAASLYRAAGIPAETIVGTAPAGSTPDNHEWVKVWDGTHWVQVDPTWNSTSVTWQGYELTNKYLDTDALKSSHTPDPNRIGTWE